MIRPLRRAHRWLMPGLFVVLAIAAVLTLTHRAASGRIGALPAAIGGVETRATGR